MPDAEHSPVQGLVEHVPCQQCCWSRPLASEKMIEVV
jgi:hypothetical protein